MTRRSKLSACAAALAILIPQASFAQVAALLTENRNVVSGDAVFLSVNRNGGTPTTGRGQIVSVSSSGVRIRATLLNAFSGSVIMVGLTSSGAGIPGCEVTILGPRPKPPAEVLCPTTAVRYSFGVGHGI